MINSFDMYHVVSVPVPSIPCVGCMPRSDHTAKMHMVLFLSLALLPNSVYYYMQLDIYSQKSHLSYVIRVLKAAQQSVQHFFCYIFVFIDRILFSGSRLQVNSKLPICTWAQYYSLLKSVSFLFFLFYFSDDKSEQKKKLIYRI